MLKASLLVSLILLSFGCSKHAALIDEFEARSFSIGGKTYNYRIRVPKDRDPSTKIPVMLYLHGSGSRGDDNRSPADGVASVIEPVLSDVNFIIVVPQCRNETFWSSVDMSNYALAALDQTVKEFNGDVQRLYLAGFSLGAYGTWQIAAANPGKFAALVPIAGGVVGERPIDPQDRAAIIPSVGEMLDSDDPYKAVATAIGNTSVWVFHGTKDESVPVDFARKIVGGLKDNGNVNVKYTEFSNDGHMIASKVFGEPGFLEWLAEQELRKPARK